MKSLTIIQPWASLIAMPDDDPRAKRVENRTWTTSYRGRLAIHAGKSREGAGEAVAWGLDFAALPRGAIVATANLAGCVPVNGEIPAWALRRWPWLEGDPHVEGPWCWVLTEVMALPVPVPCSGAQGLWDVPGAWPVDVLHEPRRRKKGGDS